METKTIKGKSGKILANVYSFLDVVKISEKDKFIDNILKDIPKSDSVGYAGFTSKKALLVDGFKNSIFSSKFVDCKIDSLKQVISKIDEGIKKCSEVLRGEVIEIFVFPNFDLFVKEKMFGVFGYTPWKNTIHLYINSLEENHISYTLSHELSHALSPYPLNENSISVCMLYEGIAERFREKFLGGAPAPWSTAVPKSTYQKILFGLDLDEVNFNLYHGLFFGSKKYPLWVGYTIGYNMSEKYIKSLKNFDWGDLIRKDLRKVNTRELL